MIRIIKAWIYKRDKDRCVFCGRKLQEYEKKYYENSCNKCEAKLMKRINKEK